MSSPKKFNEYECPFGHRFGQGSSWMGVKAMVSGTMCKNNCSDYKNNTCPKFKRE